MNGRQEKKRGGPGLKNLCVTMGGEVLKGLCDIPSSYVPRLPFNEPATPYCTYSPS